MNNRFPSKRQNYPRIPTKKLVSFQLGKEKYAIPIEQVNYVVHEFTFHGILENGISIVQERDRTIPIIDLSVIFFSSNEVRQSQYLIVCKLEHGNILGIPLPDMPTILEVPTDKFTDIPELYRQNNLHPAVEKIIQAMDNVPIFYINLEKIIK